ncbi:MAG: hypothetical protein N2109_02285 [Fimbriimonadales bacterium]|nr:hypothetical protein [Fimbriimonadales bacterium]
MLSALVTLGIGWLCAVGLGPSIVHLVPVAAPAVLQNDESEDDFYLDLFGWAEVTIIPSDPPSLVAGSVTKADLIRWVSMPLREEGIEVIDDFSKTAERFRARYKDAGNASERLLAMDTAMSWLGVELAAVKTADGTRVVSVDLVAFRSAIVPPFRHTAAVVWRAGRLVAAGPEDNLREEIRGAIADLMALLAADVRKARKVKPSDDRLFDGIEKIYRPNETDKEQGTGYRF